MCKRVFRADDDMKEMRYVDGVGGRCFSECNANTGPLPLKGKTYDGSYELAWLGVGKDESAEVPNCRTAERDKPVSEELLTEAAADRRSASKAYLDNISSFERTASSTPEEDIQFGTSALRQMEGSQAEKADPIRLLPQVLSKYAANLARDRHMSRMTAAVAVIAGASTALGKGVFTVTEGDEVHPNLHILNIAPSGTGKKSFHVPMRRVSKALAELESVWRRNAEQYQKDLKAEERALQQAEAKGSGSEKIAIQARITKLRILSAPYLVYFGEDTTPQILGKTIVKDGHGGACVVNSEEALMFFANLGPRSKGDAGYASLMIKGFNDAEYAIARVGTEVALHGRVENPRIFATLSLQDGVVPDVLASIRKCSGLLQRMMFLVGESGNSSRSGYKLSRKQDRSDPFELAYAGFVNAGVERCWAMGSKGTELTFSEEAWDVLQEHSGRYGCLTDELRATDPDLAEYVARSTEQVIKLVQTFHVAACTNAASGAINWTKVAKPISADTLNRAIEFHEIWTENTRRFVDRWIKPSKSGFEKGLTVEWMTAKLNQLMARLNVDGVSARELQKYCFTRFRTEEVEEFLGAHPEKFCSIPSKGKGKPLYGPIVNTADLIDLIEKGGSREAA